MLEYVCTIIRNLYNGLFTITGKYNHYKNDEFLYFYNNETF